MNIRRIARHVRRSLTTYQPLIDIAISKEAILHNLHTYQAHYPSLQFAPVLKSNAYGHGLNVVAEILDDENIAFFAVDSLYEARQLRKNGINSPIVIIGYVRPEYIAASNLRRTDYTIVDIEQLAELVLLAKKSVRIHLKIDTGMHRQGILPSDVPEALQLIQSNPHVHLVGVCSHFADADSKERTHTNDQIAVWEEARALIRAQYPDLEFEHIAATKGVPWSEAITANVARLGIGLYGYDTSPSGAEKLQGALSMRTFITSIRTVPRGDFVGYNATYVAEDDVQIATVPTGYYEGVNRRLSNKASFTIRDQPAPIAGRVSMNMTSIDVANIPGVQRGDEVIVISNERSHSNSVEKLAALADTTPYVILAGIPQHLRRIVV